MVRVLRRARAPIHKWGQGLLLTARANSQRCQGLLLIARANSQFCNKPQESALEKHPIHIASEISANRLHEKNPEKHFKHNDQNKNSDNNNLLADADSKNTRKREVFVSRRTDLDV